MTRRIDRTTTHTCPGLERDQAYFAAQGRDLFSCDEGHPRITVQYVQFPTICAECRRECLDESDVASESCAWCGADLDTADAFARVEFAPNPEPITREAHLQLHSSLTDGTQCPQCHYLAPRAQTRKCAAWLDCGHTAVPVADLSFRGFCPDCERVANS